MQMSMATTVTSKIKYPPKKLEFLQVFPEILALAFLYLISTCTNPKNWIRKYYLMFAIIVIRK